MIRAYTTYGALDTKVRAMYGRRLRGGELRRLAAADDLGAVLDFLREHPGWQRAVEGLTAETVTRGALESALRSGVRADYLRLAGFVPGPDRPIASFPVLLAELEAILAALRRLRSGETTGPPASEFLSRGRLDTGRLALCRDFDGLVEAAAGTVYARALARLRPDPGGALPDLLIAESLLRSAYYAAIYRLIHSRYAGETRAVLLRSFGQQVDLLNIIHMLRLKRYFPGSGRALTVLFPFHDRLKPADARALAAAPDVETCFALLERTPYAGCFTHRDVTEVEDFYRRAFYRFNRRQLLHAPPSVYSAVAYLNLRELELTALISAIESAGYGAVYDDSFAALLGGDPSEGSDL